MYANDDVDSDVRLNAKLLDVWEADANQDIYILIRLRLLDTFICNLKVMQLSELYFRTCYSLDEWFFYQKETNIQFVLYFLISKNLDGTV